MATVSKIFAFVSDTEGWNPSSPRLLDGMDALSMWREYHLRVARRAKIGLSGWYGCLSATVRYRYDGSSFYWEWGDGTSLSWESLGVLSGATITSITASFHYRWVCYMSKHHGRLSQLQFGTTDTSIGPLSLYDSTDTKVVDLVSLRNPTTARTSGNLWKFNPVVGVDFESPESNWGIASGSSITALTGVTASSSKIKLRLNMVAPAVTNAWMRLKTTHITLNITYTGGTAPVSSALFFGSD